MRTVVLRHVDCEPPAEYLPLLTEQGDVMTVRLGIDALPDPDDVDLVVTMGGPMGVYDGRDYPWLSDEVEFLTRALGRAVPCWGVCLGAQLLAAALGADVYPGGAPEVGVSDVTLTEAAATDPVFAGLPSSFPALHWHGDTFDLPEGAVRLAGSHRYANQAFRHGRSYGLQFHLEASATLAGQWLDIPEYRASAVAALGESGDRIVLEGLRAAQEQILSRARTVMARWLTLARTPDAAGR